MKKTLLLSIFLFTSVSILAQSSETVIRLSEPVQENANYEVFGEEINIESLKPMSLSEIVNQELVQTDVILETTVSEVCNKKGCFFVAQEGDYTARITFKDYGFFIPTDSKGKKVTLIGAFSVNTLTEEKAKHYAEDAGKDPESIEGPQKEYSIVATSVVIPKS